ncbi:DoxX-like family protein [Zhouia amylolytica]|nr:DoxX-like family protein [Zhouia amylolytica]
MCHNFSNEVISLKITNLLSETYFNNLEQTNELRTLLNFKTFAMKSKILFVISLLFGLMFINGGLNKFFNYMPPPDNLPEELVNLMTAFVESGWIMPLLAIVEIIGGILFIIPKYRALGAAMIFPVMVGILLTHIIIAPSGLPIAMVLFAINLWVIYENRHKYSPMIQ